LELQTLVVTTQFGVDKAKSLWDDLDMDYEEKFVGDEHEL
jgi:hypothetical protein